MSALDATPEVTRAARETHGTTPVEVTWIRTPDGAELALSRVLPASGEGARGAPVVLVHGSYSKRNFWVSPKGVGLAPFLAERGFDPWVVELRGHGLSPKGERYAEITAEDHLRRDLPAIQQRVHAVTGQPAFWAGHSAGGLYTGMALAAGWLDGARMRGVVTLGSQIAEGVKGLWFPGVPTLAKALIRVLGHVPAPRLGLGPEIEPAAEMLEFIRWKGWRGRWRTRDGFCYAEGMRDVRVPWFSIAGTADTNDPPNGCRLFLEGLGSADKTFVELGAAYGFEKDYDHVGLVVSKEAEREVWPRIATWMEERT